MRDKCFFCNQDGDEASDTHAFDKMSLQDCCIYVVALEKMNTPDSWKATGPMLKYMDSNFPNAWVGYLSAVRDLAK